MAEEKNENGKAWAEIFKKYNLLESIERDGFVDVTANQIREFREPRHLGKIDHKENLPLVFETNELGILTISNSSYRVGKFKVFADLPQWQLPGDEVETVYMPPNIETLNITNISSEQAAINTAQATGMIEALTGEEVILTINGKMTAGSFDFEVEKNDGGFQPVSVSGARMEIDAGFESAKAFYVIEAKNHASRNFNMRQLYYPYRAWSKKINKPVVPVFMTLSQDVFDFYKFDFADQANFSSFALTEHRRFMIQHAHPLEATLVDLGKATLAGNQKYPVIASKENTFPQADKFGRVMDLISALLEGPKSVDEIATYYDFDPRQSDYYFKAAKYLGLAGSSKEDDGIERRHASALAEQIWSLPYAQKYQEIAALMLSDDAIAKTYLELVAAGRPSRDRVIDIFVNSPSSKCISGETINRRASTLSEWVLWLGNITQA